MKQTPLHAEHVALGARMIEFAGWQMPLQYVGIVFEHQHCRTRTALFDTSHMGEFMLSGPTAESDLEHLLTAHVASLQIGQCRYAYLLDADGGVLDDLTCYRLAEDRFLLVVNAGTRQQDADWIRSHCSKGTSFEDASDQTAKLDVQGPESLACLAAAFGQSVPALKYFRFCEWSANGVPILLSRTGYTGEWGYELYFPAEHATEVWGCLVAAAGVQPAGLGARDTLRLEMGYPLYGHELQRNRTPVAATGATFIRTDKEFIGRDAVLRDLDQGPPERLIGLQLEGKRAARAGDPVQDGDRQIGVVTSGSFAPSVGTAIAMAYVDAASLPSLSAPACITRGASLPAMRSELPFYRNGTARRPNGEQ